MKIAIMQPYFLPYLGYFSLIKYVDHFILFDTPQYIRHGWIERNRVLKPDEGWMYIKVPLQKHSRVTTIKEIYIRNDEKWQNKILQQLAHYKRKARFYTTVINLLKEIFEFKTDSIVELNYFALKKISGYLNIETQISIFSKMDLNIEKPNAPDEWALNISLAMNAKDYINPPGGKEFFDHLKYTNSSINLHFLSVDLKKYDQGRDRFESGMSIIDLLMFNCPDTILGMLNEFKLE